MWHLDSLAIRTFSGCFHSKKTFNVLAVQASGHLPAVAETSMFGLELLRLPFFRHAVKRDRNQSESPSSAQCSEISSKTLIPNVLHQSFNSWTCGIFLRSTHHPASQVSELAPSREFEENLCLFKAWAVAYCCIKLINRMIYVLLWDTDSHKLTQVKIVFLPFWLSFIYHACYHFLKNYHFCYPFIYHFCYPVLRKYHFGYHVFIIIVIISWKNIILFVMLFIILLSFPEKLSFLYHVYYHLFIISRKMITKMINKWSPKW